MKKPIVNNGDVPLNEGEIKAPLPRNPDGTFIKGTVPNPKGKPKGLKNFTTKIREALMRIADGTGKTYEELLIDRVLIKAIQDGDSRIINQIWDQFDGKATQKIDHSTGGEPISGFTYVTPETTVPAPKPKKKKKKPTSDETNETE